MTKVPSKTLPLILGLSSLASLCQAALIVGTGANADGTGISFSSQEPLIVNFTTGTDGTTSLWSLDSVDLRINAGFFTNVNATLTGLGINNASTTLGTSQGSTRTISFDFSNVPVADKTMVAGETYTLTITPGPSSAATYSAGPADATQGNPDATLVSATPRRLALMDINASPVTPPVPEPSSTLLLGLSALGLVARRRRG